MKFQTVREFIELVPECHHCGDPLYTFIKSKKTPNTAARYTMNFNETKFVDAFDLQLNQSFSGHKQVSFSSLEAPEHLLFCYQIADSPPHPILTIEKNTNCIAGELDKIQKVLWDHQPVVRRQCINETCGKLQRNYIYESSPLILERINKKVYPFFLDTEVLVIDHNNDVYGLMTVREQRATYLMAARSMIKELPATPLYRIKGSEAIYNKIQTLVNFS